MKTIDSYDLYDEIKKHVENGGIVYKVLNDDYTASAFIYDYILYNRNDKSATVYKYIKRMGRIYSIRNYQNLPAVWENKIFVGSDIYGDKAEGYTDYGELYGDLCE